MFLSHFPALQHKFVHPSDILMSQGEGAHMIRTPLLFKKLTFFKNQVDKSQSKRGEVLEHSTMRKYLGIFYFFTKETSFRYEDLANKITTYSWFNGQYKPGDHAKKKLSTRSRWSNISCNHLIHPFSLNDTHDLTTSLSCLCFSPTFQTLCCYTTSTRIYKTCTEGVQKDKMLVTKDVTCPN